ncbi:MAG TPA: alpha/beta hydrolase family protein [Candidatus Deferrimicrobium sp.]|nr:alpha/beta hydrolase family protein [Candidatus Deferrimicrobium sp.]
MVAKRTVYILVSICIALTLVGIIGLNCYPLGIARTTHQAVTTNGELISFNLYQPKELSQPTPVVVMGHGIIVNKEMMTAFAIELAYNGFIVASLDWSGHGQSTGPLANLSNDLEAVINEIPVLQPLANMSALALLGYSMGGFATYPYSVNNSNVKAWVGVGTLADGDISTNMTPHNVLMIIGALDEAFVPETAKLAMVNLTGVASVDDVQFEHLYGNISDGTARRVHIVPGADHLITPWHHDFVILATAWITESLGGSIITPSADEVVFAVRTSFAWIGFLGLVALTFVLAFILSEKLGLQKKSSENTEELILPQVAQDQSLLSFVGKYYLLTFLLVPTIFIFVPLILFTPVPFTSALTAIVGCFGINILIYSWRLAKKWGTSIKSILKQNLMQNAKIWIYGIILTTIFFVCYYLSIGLNGLGIIPSLTRLPYLVPYCLILFFVIFFSGVFIQKFSTPFLEAKLRIKSPTARYLSIALINFLLVDSWFVILVMVPCIILGNYFIAMILILMVPIFLFMIFFSVYMEKLVGSVIPGALLNAVMIGFLILTLSPYGDIMSFFQILL